MTADAEASVARALNEVVLALGRPAAFEPAQLRPALTRALARSAVTSDRHADAIVLAAEAGIPQAMLDDVPAIDLGDRLAARGGPALATATWRRADLTAGWSAGEPWTPLRRDLAAAQ